MLKATWNLSQIQNKKMRITSYKELNTQTHTHTCKSIFVRAPTISNLIKTDRP